MEIIKVGSLEPERAIQDSVLVYSEGGCSPTIRQRDYKGPIKVLIKNEQRDKTDNDWQCNGNKTNSAGIHGQWNRTTPE